MPSWGEIVNKLGANTEPPYTIEAMMHDQKATISSYASKTGRNVILYYSSFLTKPHASADLSLCETDINAFMEAVYKLDKTKGLDLFLHTPGGDIAATEQIINYLHSIFDGDIRAVVPQISMSAGAMIAVSCKEIIMGKQSCLGPFDPQMNGIPCQSAIREFEAAVKNVETNPASLGLWQSILCKYNPTFLHSCQQAILLSEEIANKILKRNVNPDDLANVKKLFGDNSESKIHARHINKKQCTSAGLKVVDMEDDPVLQDLILTIHHSYLILLERSGIVKIVENNIGGCYIKNLSTSPES